MKLRTKLKRAKEENEKLKGQLLMQYMNPGKICCFDAKRVEKIKLRNVSRIRTDCIDTERKMESDRIICQACPYGRILDNSRIYCELNPSEPAILFRDMRQKYCPLLK